MRGEAEELFNLLVGYLIEVLVELSDRVEETGSFDTDELVDLARDPAAGVLRSHRNTEDNTSRLALLESSDGCRDAGASRDAVIYENDCAAGKVKRGTRATVEVRAPSQFVPLSTRDFFNLLFGNAGGLNDFRVQNAHTTCGHGTESKLFVAGDTELPGDEDVQGKVKCPRNFKGNGDAAAWDTEYDNVSAAGVSVEFLGQSPASIGAVVENPVLMTEQHVLPPSGSLPLPSAAWRYRVVYPLPEHMLDVQASRLQ